MLKTRNSVFKTIKTMTREKGNMKAHLYLHRINRTIGERENENKL